MHPQRQGGATLKALAFVRSARYRDRVERRANGKTGQKNFNPSSFRGNIPLPVKHLRSFSIVKIEHWKEKKRIRECAETAERINAGDFSFLVSLLRFIINWIHNTVNAAINLSLIVLIPQLEINYPRAIALLHRIQDVSPASSPARVIMKY